MVGWSLGDWWLTNRLVIHAIHIEDAEIFGFDELAWSVGHTTHVGYDRWTWSAEVLAGHQRFGLDDGGFLLRNSADDLETLVGVDCRYRFTDHLQVRIGWQRSWFAAAGGGDATADWGLISLLTSW